MKIERQTDEETKQYITKIILRHDEEIKDLFKLIDKSFFYFEKKIRELEK